MNLDIRLPMGYLFILLGGLLLVYGALAAGPEQGVPDTLHANLWWGGAQLIFGVSMLLLARRAARRPRP